MDTESTLKNVNVLLRDYLQFSLLILNAVNPLQSGVAFLYPMKTSENLKVF